MADEMEIAEGDRPERTEEEMLELARKDFELIRSGKVSIEVTPEQIEEIANRSGVDRSSRAEMARKRAQRAGMLRRLQKQFDVLSPFTPEKAADKTGTNPSVMRSYLELESSIPGSQVEKQGEDKYVLINPFS